MTTSTISISELQKNISNVFKTNTGIKIVTQNNNQTGAIISKKLLNALEKFGVLEEIEDYLLISDKESQKSINDIEKMDKKNDFSLLLTRDEIWK